MADMDLCASCGVVRVARKGVCAHCKAHHGADTRSVSRPAERFWVCLECTFQCRMCGFVVPLNHLDMDGGVACARCGLEQAFDVRAWVDALRYAHAVGELFGEPARGIDGEMLELGSDRTSLTLQVGGGNAFCATTSPGHPLCETCHGLLDVGPPGDEGSVTVTCKVCNVSATYVVPPAARKMTKGALEGLIATEHRSDRAPVKVEQTPGALAVRCPSCNASLPASDASKFLTCGYCNTVSRIPDHTWFQMSGKDPVSESMWLLFRGISALHQEFDRKAEKEARDAEAKAARAAKHDARQEEERAAKVREREREQGEKRRREQLAEIDSEELAAKKEKADEGKALRIALIGVPALFLIAVGVVVAARASNASTKTEATPAAVEVAATKPTATAKVPELVRIPSCKCLARDGSTKNTFGLQAPASGKSRWYFSWSQQTGFMTSTSDIPLFNSAAVLPPTPGTTKLRFGIACDGPVVALIGPKQASAWIGDDRKMLWNIMLPGALALPADPPAAAPPQGTEFDVSCPSALDVDSGAVALTLANGKHVSLAMKDGKVR